MGSFLLDFDDPLGVPEWMPGIIIVKAAGDVQDRQVGFACLVIATISIPKLPCSRN